MKSTINRLLLAFLTIGLLTTSCGSQSAKTESSADSSIAEEAPIVGVLELDTYLNQLKAEKRAHHFVDVRTPEEVADGTIAGAINIDFKADDFLSKFSALSKDQPVYLFCRSGNRSGQATELLIKEGYKEIYDLKGGYSAYDEKMNKQ